MNVLAAAFPENEGCDSAEVVAVTESDGSFVIPSETQFRLFHAIGDPLESWLVCFETSGALLLGHREIDIGYAPEVVKLSCEILDSAEFLSNSKELQGESEGRCWFAKV